MKIGDYVDLGRSIIVDNCAAEGMSCIDDCMDKTVRECYDNCVVVLDDCNDFCTVNNNLNDKVVQRNI